MHVQPITTEAVSGIFGEYIPKYREKSAVYQAEALRLLGKVWNGSCGSILDVGGGTGIMAEAIGRLFPVEQITSVDVEDRFRENLSINSLVYDGTAIPFESASFDAAMINDVMHHIPVNVRVPLMKDIRRVVSGPVYIKDHLPKHFADRGTLTVMDAIGNLPYGGMVKASYLSSAQWEALAAQSGYKIVAKAQSSGFRSGIKGLVFPNRLEIAMRWEVA